MKCGLDSDLVNYVKQMWVIGSLILSLFFINWVDHKVSETGSHVRFDYERVSAWVIGKIKGDDVVFMLFESSNESTIVVA
jgi:hypothetical protein